MIMTNRNLEKGKMRWSFEQALAYVRKLGLKNKKEWKEYSKSGTRPDFIPSNPDSTYKNEWKGFPDWMGYDFDIHFNKKYFVNEDFFKKWTHDMAYVFGFWFADGHIYNGFERKKQTRYVWGISQDIKDEYLLKDILQKIGSNHELYYEPKRNHCRFLIISKQMVEDIIAIGGSYRKSRSCLFPAIPKEHLSDFVRGYFDGDGSVFVDCKKRKSGTFTSASKKFIYVLLELLRANINGFKARIVKDKRGNGAFYLSFDVNDAIRLRGFMYQNDGMCLKRKKDILFSFGDFNLSTTDVAKNFLAFEEARAIIRSKKLTGWKQWVGFCKSGERPANIPSNPWKTYNGHGWIGIKNWLGKE